MLQLLRNNRILVVVAHPDDELLGLGATLNKLVTDFDATIRVVILGEGITSRSRTRDNDVWKRELAVHKKNIEKARRIIGYQSFINYDFPDNRFDSVQLLDLIKTVEKEKSAFQPEVIFTHHGGDLNIDHRRTFQAVVTACRPLESEGVSTIITFETPSGTEWRPSTDPFHFHPNIFIEVDKKNVDSKIKAMESYTYEKRQYPHPRSPKALIIQAQRLGIIAGCQYAEAFCLERNISKIPKS